MEGPRTSPTAPSPCQNSTQSSMMNSRPTHPPTPEVVVGVVRWGAGGRSRMKSWGSFVLAGHTRRLFLINSDVRKNKQSTNPANYALFYLILGRGGDGV